jgi:fibro-slime domain-containing protein/LPXTG-motif cell wall-anchored protein
MRKMNKRFAFSSIFLLSLTLLIIAMPYMVKEARKASASSIDPSKGAISYYRADLFDYESSMRSENGNFLLGYNEFDNDAALLLFNQENYYVKPEAFGQTVVPKPGEHNSWISSYKHKVVQGLVKEELDSDGMLVLANKRVAVSKDKAVKLFDETDVETYMGAYSFPFENVGNGYLQYDSSKNHVEITSTLAENKLLNMKRYDVASSSGFMPFNKLFTSLGSDENGQYALSGNRNFYFGMKVSVPFAMTKGGKITTATGEEEDMIFSFSGDDDLWVYIDDVLVLDLGGVHDKVSGQINFATGVVTTEGNHFNPNTGKFQKEVTSKSVNNTYVKSLSVGRHKLQVFYLERGGLVSNCKITFRLQEDKTPAEIEDSSDELVGPKDEENKDEETTPTQAPNIPTDTPSSPTEGPTEENVVPSRTPVNPSRAPQGMVEKEEYVSDDEASEDFAYRMEDIIVEKEVSKGDTDLANGDGKGTIADDEDKQNEDTVKIFDLEVPLGFLPKTGTISGIVFYMVGALLIIVGVAMIVVRTRSKK